MTESNPSGKKTDARVDGIVDELRNVLSALGPAANGNGHPAEAAPAPVEPERVEPVQAAPDPVIPEPPMPAPAPVEMSPVEEAPEPPPPAPVFEVIPPDAPAPVEPVAAAPAPAAPVAPSEPTAPAWLFMSSEAVSPLQAEPEKPAPREPERPRVEGVGSGSGALLDPWAMSGTDVPMAPPAPSSAENPAEIEIEIGLPGTKDVKDKPAPKAPSLELEGTQMKPEGMHQIACIFPEGQEKLAQAFVRRLKEAAERNRKPTAVEAVFLSAWTPGKIDVDGWTKSAELSGADAVFILCFRSNGATFKSINLSARQKPCLRLVWLEHVTMSTLYVDALVELRREG